MLPRLYVICDADACAAAGWSLIDFAAACLDGGATLLQLRAKHVGAGPFLDMALSIVERAAPFHAAVIINDRADVARLSGAAGVHVGQDDLPPAAVRRIVGEEALVGLSTHTPEQIAQALREPISYVAIVRELYRVVAVSMSSNRHIRSMSASTSNGLWRKITRNVPRPASGRLSWRW